MKRFVLLAAFVAASLAVFYLPAGADEDTVNATVSPLVLSVEVSPNSISYGTHPLSNENVDRTAVKSPTLNASNTGSDAKLMIRGADATTAVQGDADWTLDCSNDTTGTVGQDTYVHRFKLGDQPDFMSSGAHTLCNLSGGAKELSPSVTGGTNIDFTLEIAMPTGSTGTSERSTTVTVIAVAP